ncbi:hypothetical protein [Picrophilus oshimae]|nr:hypothetical protein [Picrophilus oshimae]
MGNKMDNVYGGIAFNMSSISIKKDFINIDHLKNNVFINPDIFMYYSCLENHGRAIDIKEILTVYRINNSVTNAVTKSFDDYESKRLKKAMLFNDGYLIFLSIFKNKNVVHDIKSNIFLNNLTIFSREKYKRPRYFIYFLLYKKYWNKRFAIFEYFSLLILGDIARSVLTNKRKKRFFNYISKYEANGEF